jgi:hypothetical protein
LRGAVLSVVMLVAPAVWAESLGRSPRRAVRPGRTTNLKFESYRAPGVRVIASRGNRSDMIGFIESMN